jgi:hypothetical protein
MTLLVQNNGEGDALSAIVAKAAAENLVLRLFKSNTTPGETDTAATYTEADFTGYAAITLTPSSWTVTEGAPSDASYPQQTFTSSANQTVQQVYGYYLTRVTSGRIAWAERFADGPYPVANLNDLIKVTPKITLD